MSTADWALTPAAQYATIKVSSFPIKVIKSCTCLSYVYKIVHIRYIPKADITNLIPFCHQKQFISKVLGACQIEDVLQETNARHVDEGSAYILGF